MAKNKRHPRKSNNAIKRLRVRNACMPPNRKQDIDLIDATLNAAYNNGDKRVIDLKTDVLDKCDCNYNDTMTNRLWDILDSTNLLSPVVGFGNRNKLSITVDGYNMMSKYGGYKNFLSHLQKQSEPTS